MPRPMQEHQTTTWAIPLVSPLRVLHSIVAREVHSVWSTLFWWLHTAVLFTWTDYKTLFLPVVSTVFLGLHNNYQS